MQNFRTILREVIKKQLPNEPVALLFSGGTDSLTILWTLLDLEARVTCYTFHLSYYESTDLRASRLACDFYQVPQVIINEDKGEILDQLKDVITVIKSPRKTHVEVMYGYWFLIQAVKEKHIFSGIQADTLYGSNKNSAIQYGKRLAGDFTKFRQHLLANPGQEGLCQANLIARHFNKVLFTPYSSQNIRDFFFRYSWADLNKPKQKMPAVISFSEKFRELPIYRRDDNMQCGSHLREHLATYVKQYKVIYEQTR